MLGRLSAAPLRLLTRRSAPLVTRFLATLDESLIVTKACAQVSGPLPGCNPQCQNGDSSSERCEVMVDGAQRIKELKRRDKNDLLKLRLSVEGGGCSGFSYNFQMEDAPHEETDL